MLDHFGVFELPAELLAGRFTFGFVRHPVDWLKSRWAWAVLSGFPGKLTTEPAAAGHWMADCWSDRLDDFVARYLDLHPGVATRTMLHMLGWRRRSPEVWEPTPWAVTFIGRHERLAEDLVDALAEAREPFDRAALAATAPRRVGARGPLREATRLSALLRARILAAEPALCRQFGYA